MCSTGGRAPGARRGDRSSGGGTVQTSAPRAVPPDQDRAGRCRAPEAVRVHAERTACLPAGHPRAAEHSRDPDGEVLGRRRRWASSGSVPRVKTATSGAATTKTLNRGPHSWTSEGSSQVDGSASCDARVYRQQRGPRHAVLQPGPGRPPERSGRRTRRASRPPLRRKARIWARVRSSRAPAALSPRPPPFWTRQLAPSRHYRAYPGGEPSAREAGCEPCPAGGLCQTRSSTVRNVLRGGR